MKKAIQRFSIILLFAASMLLWQIVPFSMTAGVMALGSQQEEPPPVPEVISEDVTTTNQPEQAATVVMTVTLTGAAEVPGPGDEDGTGTAILTFDTTGNTVCYTLMAENIEAPTMAHIHAGAIDASGDAVITLFSDGAETTEGCAESDVETIRTILGDPTGYYVNVHNEPFPSGALRGQLPVHDVDIPEDAGPMVIRVRLTGDAEVPGPGDEDGTGMAVLTFDTMENTVCYMLEIENIEAPTMAHIHAGAIDASGDAIVTLFSDGVETTEGCVESDIETIRAILGDPTGYYVNVHNEPFPSGALRGQLPEFNIDIPENDERPVEEVIDIPEQAESVVITVMLTGAAEVPGPGDEDGIGTAILTFDTISNTVCYTLMTENIDAPTAGHIHIGATDASGDAVIPLFGDGADAEAGCAMSDAETVGTILDDPAGYYVNIHNEPFPAGAIRGQLLVHDTEMPEDTDTTEHATSMVMTVTLTGAAEVPGPGDEDGIGTAILTFDTISNTVCYTLMTENIDAPTAGHIHIGATDASGDAVIPLFGDSADADTGCATSDAETIGTILDNPAGYYVNIHNEPFPAGAIRGQLPAHNADIPDETERPVEEDMDKPESMTLTVILTGAAEVPGPGDEDGTGTAILTFDTISNTVCYTLTTENIDAPTAGHIHIGATDASGDAVIPLFGDGADAEAGCATSDAETVGTILDDPAGYYVNIHNEPFPAGAIRGQLPAHNADIPEDIDTSVEDGENTEAPGLTTSTVISITLTGAAEVPNPGDEDGTGTIVLTFDTISNTVCYTLVTENIDAPTMAHIHEGAEDASGSPVVTLFSDSTNVDEGCVTPESRIARSTNQAGTIIETILANPSDYYVNVHNDTFPAGALRGQLTEPQTAGTVGPEAPTALDLADEPMEYSIYLPLTVR